MKETSKLSGASAEYVRWFNERYRDKDGILLVEKLAAESVPISPDEWQRILREGPNGERKKKKDDNPDNAA